MKIFSFKKCALWFAFIYAVTAAAAERENLEPCETSEYYTRIDKLMDDAVKQKARLAITVVPSYEAEAGLRIGDDSVALVQFDKSFWRQTWVKETSGGNHQDFSLPRVQTTVDRATLRGETIRRILPLFRDAIAGAKPAARQQLDGVSYRFSVDGAGCAAIPWLGGDAKDGPLARLVKLLANHAETKDAAAAKASEDKIVSLLEALQAVK